MSAAAVATPDLETPAVEPEQPETPEVQPETPPEQPPETAKPDAEPKLEGKVDGRQLPIKLREMMTALQKADPKAHGFLKDVLFRDRQLSQEFPGGLAEAKKFKEQVQTFEKDFPDGIEGIKAEQAEWNAIDQAWANSDPKVIDVWADANPQAFSTLMPTAINKFAQMDGDGYQRYMAKVIVSTLGASGVEPNLRLLDRMAAMNDVEGIKTVVKELLDWTGSMGELAKSQPKPPEKAPELDKRAAELEDREATIWAQETAGKVNPYRESLIRKEATQYLPKGVTMDDETFEAIDGQVQRNADKLLMSDPTFVKQFAAYSDAKDSEGLVAFMRQKLDDVLKSKPGKPGAIEKAVKLFYRQAPAAKPAAPAKPAAQGAKPAAAPQNWTKLDKPPAQNLIDFRKSTFEMRFDKQAILKDGKRVYWGDKIPA